MTQESIPTYTRIVNGKPVTVKAHSRANNEAAEAASKLPGRPPVAAHVGRYAGDRVLPNIWAADLNKKAEQAMAEDPEEEDKVLPPAKNLEEATQRILAELEFYEPTPEVEELKNILKRLPTDTVNLSIPVVSESTELLMLALSKKKVSVKGYFRRTENGLVHVRPYQQVRDLMSMLGGPKMAAQRGITQDLMYKALAEDHRKPRGSGVSARTPSGNAPSAPEGSRTPNAPQQPNQGLQGREVTPAAPEGTWNNPEPASKKTPSAKPSEVTIDSPELQRPSERPATLIPNMNPYSAPPRRAGAIAFINPYTGESTPLAEGETMRKKGDQVAIFTPDGEMKESITPNGPTPGVKNSDISQWRDTHEPSLTVPDEVASPASSEGEATTGPSAVPRTFIHPSGVKVHLGADNDIMRHKTREGSYVVVNGEGVPTHRIAASGRKYSVKEANMDAFEALPGSEADEMTRESLTGDTKPARKDRLKAPRASEVEPEAPEQEGAAEAPTPEVEEAPTWDPDAPTIFFDQTQPQMWNRGIDAARSGLSYEQAWQLHSSRRMATRDIESRRNFREGFDHYQEQKSVYDNWESDKDSIVDLPDFIFDGNFFPEAWQEQMSDNSKPLFISPDLNDNDSWRSGRPSTEGAFALAGYKAFKPGFDKQESDISDALRDNPTHRRYSSTKSLSDNSKIQEEFTSGWNDAQREWETSVGARANESEEWNQGFQHAGNKKNIPDGVSNDFKRGFNEGVQNPPLAPTGLAVKTLTPAIWDETTPDEKEAFRKHPSLNEVLDSHGNTWTRENGSFGRGPDWVSGAVGSTDYKKINTDELIDRYMSAPQQVRVEEATLNQVPIGSTVRGNNVETKVEDNNEISVNGVKVEPNLKDAVLTHQKYDGGRVSTYGGGGANQTKMAHQREFERDLSNSLVGLHPITKSLFAGRVHLENAQDKKAPSTTTGGYIRWDKNNPSALPTMHFPQRFSRTVKEKERITPNKNGASMLVRVDDGNELARTMAVSHETGKYLDATLNRLLEPDEQKAMYREFRDEILKLVPEDKRDGFDSFIPSGDRLKTPRTQRPKPNESDYEFFRAFEFVNQNAPQSIQKELSKVAARNPKDLIGQAWTSHTLNSDAPPIASAIGGAMEKGLNVGGSRLQARLNGVDFEERYTETVAPRYPTPREDVQNRMRGPVQVTQGFFTIGEGTGSFSVSRRTSKVTLPDRLTLDAATDHASMVDYMRELGRPELRGGVTNENQSLTAARLGYDFDPNARAEMVGQALRIASSDFALSAREEKFWNKVQTALDSDDDTNLPTPQDIMSSGRNGNRIMKKLGESEWVAYMPIDRTAPQGIPEYEGENGPITTPHGISVEAQHTSVAKDMYAKTSRIFSEMQPSRLSEIVSPIRNDYPERTDSELAATAVVDYYFGSKNAKYLGIVDTIEPQAKREKISAWVTPGRLAQPGRDPQGMDGYNNWLDNYQEGQFLKSILDSFPRTQGGINERLREDGFSPVTTLLDRGFASAPRTTESLRVYIPTGRQTLVEPGRTVRDKGYMRGTLTPSNDSDSPQMAVNLPKGSKVLFDGTGFILPRGSQFKIDTADEENNIMEASVSSPVSEDRFIRPPQPGIGPNVRRAMETALRRERERIFRSDPDLRNEYQPDTAEYHAQQALTPTARNERNITASVAGSVRLNGGIVHRMARNLDSHSEVTVRIQNMARDLQARDKTLTNEQAFARAAQSLGPMLHYSTTFKGTNYFTGSRNALSRLKERGHTVEAVVSRGPEGSRAVMVSPTGTRYTIDFHTTPTKIKSGLAGRLLLDAAYEVGESLSLHSEEAQMAQFVARNAVMPPGAQTVAEGLGEAVTSMPVPPPPPPPPTTPPEMKPTLEDARKRGEDPAVLQAIIRMDAKSIAELYYGVGIPPQVWFALLQRYNGNLPPELRA